jgi:nucleoid-associated protein YgaU
VNHLARPKNKQKKLSSKKTTVKIEPIKKASISNQDYLERVSADLRQNKSIVNLVLGGLIVVVVAALLINYFNKQSNINAPGDQTTQNLNSANPANNAQKYTVKEGDTLFIIAENFYKDGNRYTEIVEANKLTGENIEVGQELVIPQTQNNNLSPSPSASVNPSMSPSPDPTDQPGTGGAINQTIWGEKIEGNTYTVQSGDWLSKIAGRAYGDINGFDKIAQANNLSNPDLIEVGTVLKIPR